MHTALGVITGAVVVVDGVLVATGAIAPSTAVLLFLTVEVPMGILVARGYLRQWFALRRTRPRREALRDLVDSDPLLRAARTEVSTLAALARWLLRRPDVPSDAQPLSRGSGGVAIPMALAVAAVVELVALHLLLPWPVPRLVADLAGCYGLVMILGVAAGWTVRPHLLFSDALVVRSGGEVVTTISLADVASIRDDRRLSPLRLQSYESNDGGTGLAVAGPDGSHVTISLRTPVTASIPTVPWRRPRPLVVTELRLALAPPSVAVLVDEWRTRWGANPTKRATPEVVDGVQLYTS